MKTIRGITVAAAILSVSISLIAFVQPDMVGDTMTGAGEALPLARASLLVDDGVVENPSLSLVESEGEVLPVQTINGVIAPYPIRQLQFVDHLRASEQPMRQTTTKFKWRYCKGVAPSSLKDVQVALSPYPPRKNHKLLVHFLANLSRPLDHVTFSTNLTINGWFPFKEQHDYCSDADVTCPIPVGKHQGTLKYDVASFISTISGQIEMFSQGQSHMCIQIARMDVI